MTHSAADAPIIEAARAVLRARKSGGVCALNAEGNDALAALVAALDSNET